MEKVPIKVALEVPEEDQIEVDQVDKREPRGLKEIWVI